MNISRRRFMRTGSKLGLAALFTGGLGSIAFGQKTSSPPLGSGVGPAVPKQALGDPLYKITRSMFEQNLRSKFTFSLGQVKLTEMTLTTVNNLNPPGFKGNPNSSKECFSLVFMGPASLPLKQGTYRLTHSKLGTFDLFIVPGDSDKTWKRYGADINRLNP